MKELDFTVIGQRIRKVRTEKKLTQEYLAEKTGVNVSHISNIETNKVKVSLTLLVSICNVLDVTVDYILSNEYRDRTYVTDSEIYVTLHNMDKQKLDTLMRIAKIL